MSPEATSRLADQNNVSFSTISFFVPGPEPVCSPIYYTHHVARQRYTPAPGNHYYTPRFLGRLQLVSLGAQVFARITLTCANIPNNLAPPSQADGRDDM